MLKHGEVLDRLIPMVESHFFVLVDFDVEFFDRTYLQQMLDVIRISPEIVEVGAAFNPKQKYHIEPHGGALCLYNQRIEPCLALYRTEVREMCMGESWAFYSEPMPDTDPRKFSIWDTGGRIHYTLMRLGKKSAVMPPTFYTTHYHYGGLARAPARSWIQFTYRRLWARVRLRLLLPVYWQYKAKMRGSKTPANPIILSMEDIDAGFR